MAGFYNVLFASVAPKAAETAANFMDEARCIRARLYAFMNVPLELCEDGLESERKQATRQDIRRISEMLQKHGQKQCE